MKNEEIVNSYKGHKMTEDLCNQLISRLNERSKLQPLPTKELKDITKIFLARDWGDDDNCIAFLDKKECSKFCVESEDKEDTYSYIEVDLKTPITLSLPESKPLNTELKFSNRIKMVIELWKDESNEMEGLHTLQCLQKECEEFESEMTSLPESKNVVTDQEITETYATYSRVINTLSGAMVVMPLEDFSKAVKSLF